MSAATAITNSPASSGGIGNRVETLDWSRISTDLDAQGWASIDRLLTPGECRAIAELCEGGGRFHAQAVKFDSDDPQPV